jgi:hypothetical protein
MLCPLVHSVKIHSPLSGLPHRAHAAALSDRVLSFCEDMVVVWKMVLEDGLGINNVDHLHEKPLGRKAWGLSRED